jgi:hypothetical protein
MSFFNSSQNTPKGNGFVVQNSNPGSFMGGMPSSLAFHRLQLRFVKLGEAVGELVWDLQ